MTQSIQLSDYVPVIGTQTLMQSVFPDKDPDQMQQELERLSEAIIPDLHIAIKSHIDTMYIPSVEELGQPGKEMMLPVDFASNLAQLIDEHLPDANIVQKAVIYWHYLPNLLRTAIQDYSTRIQDKANRSMKEQMKEAESHVNEMMPNVMNEEVFDKIRSAEVNPKCN